MNAVRPVHVDMSGRSEQDGVARRQPAESMRRRFLGIVRLRFDDTAANAIHGQDRADQPLCDQFGGRRKIDRSDIGRKA